MAKHKKYNYSKTVMLPVSPSEQLMPGTLEFAIHTLLEERMDMSRFDAKFKNDETGRFAYDPKVLLKVVLLAYSRYNTLKEDRAGLQGKRSFHGTDMRSVSGSQHNSSLCILDAGRDQATVQRCIAGM